MAVSYTHLDVYKRQGLCGLTVKKLHWKWMEDYALPISLIAGMLLAIPITNGVYALVGLA